MSTLADRYGTPSPARRPLLLGLVGVLAVGFLVWVVWAAWFHSTPAVESELTGYRIVDANRAVANVVVSLADGADASCTLRAYSADHTTVGELAFEPRPGRNEVTVRTERRATSVTLLGCTAAGQPRPR